MSFREFDLAFINVDDRIIASGEHPNLLRLLPRKPEEAALCAASWLRQAFSGTKKVFARYFLDLIIAV